MFKPTSYLDLEMSNAKKSRMAWFQYGVHEVGDLYSLTVAGNGANVLISLIEHFGCLAYWSLYFSNHSSNAKRSLWPSPHYLVYEDIWEALFGRTELIDWTTECRMDRSLYLYYSSFRARCLWVTYDLHVCLQHSHMTYICVFNSTSLPFH